jgi:serine protease
MNFRPVHVIAVGALCLLGSYTAGAQINPKFFKFPHGVSAGDYVHQSVLVKLKPDHRSLFGTAGGRGATLASAPGFAGAREMVPARSDLVAKSQRGPRRSASTVDIGLYYRVRCTPGTSIEAFINELYQTGHFERVEPEYVNHLTYTPNDPSQSAQYYLANIRAYEAWDITHGSSDIVIGIVDSGGDLVHEDLAANMYSNSLDPEDGVDDDGNLFIDDYRGWDFVGDNVANLNDPNYLGDNNPQLASAGIAAHGVTVAGCASAVTDNNKGIAGVGFNTRIMHTKHSADNEPNGTSIYLGYDGMLYAALRGVNIINTSWGGPFRSEIIQDLVNYITNDLGILIVGAAGNSGIEAEFYPAAYDGVLSVAAINQTNGKATFSNFGAWVDVAAPGVAILTTSYGGNYTSTQGTSFSSPITAGAAALVMAQFPSYTPQQVAEQIRVSADASALYSANPALPGRLGYGVLDIYSALTKSSPAVRASKPKLLNANGSPAQQGQTGYLTFNFKNVLAATTPALEISLSETSAFITVTKATVRPGAIGAGATINNKLTPFEITIASFVPDNFELPLTISYTDGTYVDQEVVTFLLNPTFIDVDENLVTTTVSNTARVGYEDTESSTRVKGSGFVFDGVPLLFEMGVIMGTSSGNIYNNVRGINSTYDQDFVSIGSRITELTPGERSTSEIVGTVSNSATAAAQAFQLTYRSLAWKETPYDKFVIMEYTVTNPTAVAINNFFLGLFSDWDITGNGAADRAEWEDPLKLGYVFPVGATGLPHAGIQLLTNGTPAYFAIDNNQAAANNPFGLYDGFTDGEKFQSISSGLGRLSAGGTGGDVSHVVGSGPFSIPAGQQIKIAFALHAAPNADDLFLSAKYADSVYNYTLNAPQPVIPTVNACYGATASITASGASSFKWYNDFTGGSPFFTGSNYLTPTLFNDTTFYVSNADESYESVRTPAHVVIKANPKVSASGSLAVCDNETVTLSAEPADSYLWSNGATTQAISISTPDSYSVTVSSVDPVCQNVSDPVAITNVPAPTADFDYTGDLASKLPIQFTDLSTGAATWSWNFGNSTSSTVQNPSVTYYSGDTYEVTLTVQAANGCRDTVKQTLDVITGLHRTAEPGLGVSPNPASSVWYVSVTERFPGLKTVELLTLQGRTVFLATTSSSRIEIPAADYPDGLYIIRVAYGDRVVNRKVLKVH